MRDLPPIGSRVRCRGGVVGVIEGDWIFDDRSWLAPPPRCFVRWSPRGGDFFAADEIEEVLTDGR